MTGDSSCINPSEITPEDLIAYAQQEATPAAARHIENCDSCRAQSGTYFATEQLLHAGLARRSCLSSDTIREYALGQLTPEETSRAAAHMVECPSCLSESRELAAFLREPDESAAAGILTALRRLFAQPQRPAADAVAALRGVAAPEDMTYAVEDYLVHLSTQSPAPGRRGKVLAGIVEQRSGEPVEGTARLYRDAALLQTEAVDDLGNFMFGEVARGSYALELTTSDARIIIDPILVS
jgi:hypothetical protein